MTTDLEFVARLLAIPLALTIDPFAPLLVLGVALRAGWITDPVLNGPAFAGFTEPLFLAIVGALYVLHILADKVPALGHLFDAIGLLAKPLAGALLGLWMADKLDHGSTLHWYAMAVVLFGGIPAAAGLQLARTKVRLAASVGSVGALHPFASTAENLIALPIAVLSVLRPELALLLVAVIVVPILWLGLLAIRFAVRSARRLGRAAWSRRPRPASGVRTRLPT